jgi:hypothetical protein
MSKKFQEAQSLLPIWHAESSPNEFKSGRCEGSQERPDEIRKTRGCSADNQRLCSGAIPLRGKKARFDGAHEEEGNCSEYCARKIGAEIRIRDEEGRQKRH